MSVGTSMINRGAQGAGVGTSISPGYGTLIGGVAGLGSTSSGVSISFSEFSG